MSSNWPEVRKIVNAALDQPPEKRQAYAKQACGHDVALREAVWSLLSDDSVPAGFLEPPIEGAAVHLAAGSADRAEAIEHMGRYRVTEVIDSGGTGTVYRAVPKDDENAPPVAVKVLKRGMTGDDMQRRFRQEQEVLARLKHRNIARFIDGGVTSGGLLYLVMEFIEGWPIDRFCDQQKLPVSDRLELFEDVCSAVQYSHRNLVVHRDLKPRNILVTDDGVPKLLDFGIAKLIEDGSSGLAADLTVTANRMITPQYASPEQIKGGPISTATDVYSLGVVLYELLTGHRPYDLRGKARGEILDLIGEADPTSPSTQVMQTEEVTYLDGSTTTLTPELVSVARGTDPQGLRRELTGDLDTIVLTAMHKDPDRRYASAERLAEDLHRYRTGLPILAHADTFSYRARKFIRRNKAATIAATIAFISLIAGTTGLAIGLQEAQTAKDQLAAEAETARMEAKKAARINEFLQTMISAADPFGGNPEIPLRQLIDEAANRLSSSLSEEPEVRAAIERVLGDTYLSLGELEKADLHLGSALRFCREQQPDSLDLAYVLNDMAELLRARGQYEEGERLCRESLQLHNVILGPESSETASVMNNLGAFLLEKADFERAEAMHRKVLAVREKTLGASSPEVAQSLNNIGLVLVKKGAFTEAESVLRESIRIYRESLGERHLNSTSPMGNLASVLQQRDDQQAAESLYREVLAICREALGEDHPSTAHAANNVGYALLAQGQHEEAVAFLQEALAIRRSVYGDVHPSIATGLNNLASVFRERGSHDQAEQFYREAINVARQVRTSDHPIVATYLNNLASLQHLTGKYAEAEASCREALEIRRRTLPEGHPDFIGSLALLGVVLSKRDEFEKALPLFREYLDVCRTVLPEEHWRIGQAQSLLGDCLMALERYEEAEPILIASLDVAREKYGEKSGPVSVVLDQLSDLYGSLDQPERAAEYRALLEKATGGDESKGAGEEPSPDVGQAKEADATANDDS